MVTVGKGITHLFVCVNMRQKNSSLNHFNLRTEYLHHEVKIKPNRIFIGIRFEFEMLPTQFTLSNVSFLVHEMPAHRIQKWSTNITKSLSTQVDPSSMKTMDVRRENLS